MEVCANRFPERSRFLGRDLTASVRCQSEWGARPPLWVRIEPLSARSRHCQVRALVREQGYREPRVALRPVLDAVRRCLVVPRPLRIGFLAAVFLAAGRLLCEVFFFDDRFLVAASPGFGFCLVTVAKVFFFDDPPCAGDVDFFFCLVPAARLFAAPITAPETAPITLPTTGAPSAVPATAPATAPPRVLPTVPLVVCGASSSLFLSSIFLPKFSDMTLSLNRLSVNRTQQSGFRTSLHGSSLGIELAARVSATQ